MNTSPRHCLQLSIDTPRHIGLGEFDRLRLHRQARGMKEKEGTQVYINSKHGDLNMPDYIYIYENV